VHVANRISPFMSVQRDTTILDERSATRTATPAGCCCNIAISLIEGFEGYGLITTLINSKASIICLGYLIDSCSSKKQRPGRKRSPKQGWECRT
jgi:hypothetical protein